MSRELEKAEHAGIAVGDTVYAKGPRRKTPGRVVRIYRLTPTALFRYVVEWRDPKAAWLLPRHLYRGDVMTKAEHERLRA